MTGVIFINIILNAGFFSIIFWILTFLGKMFYTHKQQNFKSNFYECGFKSLSSKKIQYDINYLLLVIFLLIYDGEFLILIPFVFNSWALNLFFILNLFFFIFWLLLALIIDYIYGALDWQNNC